VILVTGGAGFVGLNLAEQLSARGDDVVLYDLAAPPPEFKWKVVVEKGDVTNRARLEEVFLEHQPKQVVHLAAITAGPQRDAAAPLRIAEVNLIGTINVLDQVRKHGVRRLVHASTGALFGTAGVDVPVPLHEERHAPVPDSMYGITKYAAERTCLRLADLWQLDVRIGRLALAYGRWEYASGARDRLSPPTEIARIACAGGEAVFPPLGDTDYIYAPDVARALIALLDAGSPKRFPEFRWKESSEGCNVVPLAPRTRTRFNTRRLSEDLGFKPRFPPAAAARDFAAWLEAHPNFQ
jgi:nucleoside-diphosphate-sugar epimerase